MENKSVYPPRQAGDRDHCPQCGETVVYLPTRPRGELAPVDAEDVTLWDRWFNALRHTHHRVVCLLHYQEKRTCGYCGGSDFTHGEFLLHDGLPCCPACRTRFRAVMRVVDQRRYAQRGPRTRKVKGPAKGQVPPPPRTPGGGGGASLPEGSFRRLGGPQEATWR